jgi:CarD family transcriptional regulator
MVSDELDPRKYENTYRELMSTGKCADLISLIKFLYSKEKTAFEGGKKLGQIDQRYLKNAETRVDGEFAIALDIPREQVHDFIAHHLEDIGK